MAKSYKQLYEELKAHLEAQPQSQPITEEEMLALKAVVYGCNMNTRLQNSFHNGMRFEDAIVIVDKLIERLAK